MPLSSMYDARDKDPFLCNGNFLSYKVDKFTPFYYYTFIYAKQNP